MSKLKFGDLSESLQQKYHYDPQASLDYQIKQQQAELELRQRLITDSRIATESQNKWIDEELWKLLFRIMQVMQYLHP